MHGGVERKIEDQDETRQQKRIFHNIRSMAFGEIAFLSHERKASLRWGRERGDIQLFMNSSSYVFGKFEGREDGFFSSIICSKVKRETCQNSGLMLRVNVIKGSYY